MIDVQWETELEQSTAIKSDLVNSTSRFIRTQRKGPFEKPCIAMQGKVRTPKQFNSTPTGPLSGAQRLLKV